VQHADLFEGIYDNTVSQRREIWLDGRISRYAARKAVGTTETQWRELHKPWGSYPDYPGNASAKAG
jgi:hypothetical protein